MADKDTTVAGSIAFAPPSPQATGTAVVMTVVDPSRLTTDTITVPSLNGPIVEVDETILPYATPTDTAGKKFTFIGDNPVAPAGPTTQWGFTA